MKKSPMDDLFHDLYGFYPNKAGHAYELLVAAAIKILTGQSLKYDQHLKGSYSNTDYQIDGLNEDENKIIEAKDYTLDNRKVGRSDIQKLQGALSDLNVKGGLFASATNYTSPAKKYAKSSEQNPLQKQIELYQIRPSEELDEEGRLKTLIVNIVMIIPDYSKGEYKQIYTNEAISKFKENDLVDKPLEITLDRFYKNDGELDILLSDFTRDNQPILVNMDDEYAEGCWLLHGKYIKYEKKLYGIKGIDYKIPYSKSSSTLRIENEGKPRILIKSEDGEVDKLLTDEQFRALTMKDGKII
jgi:hypothetical protein